MFHKHGRHGFGGPFGEEFGFGHRRGFRRGMRGRGEMKYEILEILERGPCHGYDIMLAIEEKTGLRPSPGSIYPALQMLEDGDFVRGEERDGKRIYTITNKGRELLSQREPSDEGDAHGQSMHGIIAEAMRQVHGIKDAAKQIARSGDIESYRKALEVLDKTRRALIAIIADHV